MTHSQGSVKFEMAQKKKRKKSFSLTPDDVIRGTENLSKSVQLCEFCNADLFMGCNCLTFELLKLPTLLSE